MATRLDRLTLLLDSGSTPGVRSTAASQIGQIAGQRPEDLHVLLTRVSPLVSAEHSTDSPRDTGLWIPEEPELGHPFSSVLGHGSHCQEFEYVGSGSRTEHDDFPR